jgi:glucose/arabinose dehydrogenase
MPRCPRSMAHRLCLSLVACLTCLVLVGPAWAAPRSEGDAPPSAGGGAIWPDVTVKTIASGFQKLTQVTHAGDGSGRLFAVEQAGRILVIKNGVTLDRPFLDIRDRVGCCEGERGLLSVAFPHDYAQKQHFYVMYTARNGAVTLARYQVTANRDQADSKSESILLSVPHPINMHNGGQLAFSPRDGYLYVGLGDGGMPGDPQRRAADLSQLVGKILRLDVESAGQAPYGIPSDNPYGRVAGARPEIWASGLRNPWRFSFDRITGDLYIGDVGEERYEEIDFQPAASIGRQDYGWNTMEGTHCYNHGECDTRNLTLPVWEYAHPHDSGCSAVIGGKIYRGQSYPRMFGIYFYGDYCTGQIWGLQYIGDQWQNMGLVKLAPFSVTSFGEDDAGEIYVTDQAAGRIYRIRDGKP